MFKNKKRLITSGCSYTEGHKLKSKGSWATYLAKNNDYLSAFKNNNLVGMILCLFLLFEIYFIQ